jgi:hypothetical protein
VTGTHRVALTLLAWLPVAVLVFHEPAPAQVADWSIGQICRAGIAAILLRAPRDIVATGSRGAVHYYSFRRESDKSVWRFKCMVDGNLILWGSVWEYAEGHWRVGSGEVDVRFQAWGDKIVITQHYPDGSQSSDDFARSQLAE